MVDDEDYGFLNQFFWQVDREGIIKTRSKENGHVLLTHLLMKPPKGFEIDHKDRNRLNNQKSNLRFATSAQNKMNRGPRKDCKSGYKGVSWHKQRKKWTTRIKIKNKYLFLGLFEDIKQAAFVYNNAAKKYFREFAYLNNLLE